MNTETIKEQLTQRAFRQYEHMLDICSDNKLEVLFYCAYRSFDEQAKCYRKSRTRQSIDSCIEHLRKKGLHTAANAMEKVGPQRGVVGNHITHARPGASWHQWGMALDGVPIVRGKLCWDAKVYKDEWDMYGKLAEEAGFWWAGRTWEDYPHIQAAEYPLLEDVQIKIENMLNERFPGPRTLGIFSGTMDEYKTVKESVSAYLLLM